MSGPKAGVSAAGAVVAALLASACCIGPAVLAIAGLGGAASTFLLAPYRSYLLGLSFVLLGLAFYFAYRRQSTACCTDGQDPSASSGSTGRLLLWLATLVVILVSLSSRSSGLHSLPRGAGIAMTTTVAIKGMTCGGCVAKVEERLDRLQGVESFDVSLPQGEAHVVYDPAATTPEAIAAAVRETGFAAAVRAVADP
jgi:mercuric ion transport protein